MFNGLDHIAVAVADTEEALKFWRDQLGLKVIVQESVNDNTVLLTHLDLGNTQLQLVEPLSENHPLKAWLKEHGSGLHHMCLSVDDISRSMDNARDLGLLDYPSNTHQGTHGKRAIFLKPNDTRVQLELTGYSVSTDDNA